MWAEDKKINAEHLLKKSVKADVNISKTKSGLIASNFVTL